MSRPISQVIDPPACVGTTHRCYHWRLGGYSDPAPSGFAVMDASDDATAYGIVTLRDGEPCCSFWEGDFETPEAAEQAIGWLHSHPTNQADYECPGQRFVHTHPDLK